MYVFTKDAFEDWVMSVFEAKGGFDPTNKQHRLVKEGLYGVATTLDIDSAARISLPESVREEAHLDREVTIVGNDDRLVVWDRSKHLARKAAEMLAAFDLEKAYSKQQIFEMYANTIYFGSGYYGIAEAAEGYFGKVGSRIMSLQEPTRKMSKSDPDDCYIAILDPEDAIRRKIKRAVTDSDACVRFDPENKSGVSNLMAIYSTITGKTMEEIQQEFDGQGYGAFKEAVGVTVADAVGAIQEKYNAYLADKAYLDGLMKQGAERAARLAGRTLSKVYKKVGFYRP